MKTAIKLLKFALPVLLLAGCASASKTPVQNTALQQAIENKRFVFDAQTVLPTGGVARQITGERDGLRVSGDSLRSELPYFGRVYTASVSSEGGYRFTSTAFDYSFKPRKRGGWDVSIRPKDPTTDVREFLLTLGPDGYATLQATSNNRQPISYNGQVRALQP